MAGVIRAPPQRQVECPPHTYAHGGLPPTYICINTMQPPNQLTDCASAFPKDKHTWKMILGVTAAES